MKKLSILCIFSVLFTGCLTKNPTIESTKPWEGHYYDIASLTNAIEKMQLDKDESIWIMSNYTLNRLLKNASGK